MENERRAAHGPGRFRSGQLGHRLHEPAVASLPMAAAIRGGDVDGVVFHTDRGSEYTAATTAVACRALGVVQSMGRVGCALDNAAAEAFNSTLKVEFVHRQHFRAIGCGRPRRTG